MRFVKYPEIPFLEPKSKLLESRVLVFEKLNGENCQFRKVNGIIRCGNRSGWLDEKSLGRFRWFLDFYKWAYSNPSLQNIPEDYIFYGEWLSKHELSKHETEYLPEYLDKFYLIDILGLGDGNFVDYPKAENLLKEFNLEDIGLSKILAKGKFTYKQLVNMLKGSYFYDGDKEGIVIKDYSKQEFAKLTSKYLNQKIQDNRQ